MAVEALVKTLAAWRADTSNGARVVVFGSSNTELAWHNLGRFSWSCWLNICLRHHVGKQVSLTNVGVCGETVRNLLMRLDRDVLAIRPAMVIVTIGGNDRAHMEVDEYRSKLHQLFIRIREGGAMPVAQTYYSVLGGDPRTVRPLPLFMQAMRDVASELDVACIDSYEHMTRLHKQHPEEYPKLMLDHGHLNPLGHAVFGTLCTRAFGMPDPQMPQDIAPTIEHFLKLL